MAHSEARLRDVRERARSASELEWLTPERSPELWLHGYIWSHGL